MTMPNAETVHLVDGDVHVRQDGPRDAAVLLLLHGSAAFSSSWDPLVPLLTNTHHVVRIDLLGHGRSAKPDDGDYATPEQAGRVAAVLDQLGIDRAVVVGHSTGGSVATAVAERRPDLATALALINTGPRLAAFIGPDASAVDLSRWPPSEAQVRQLANSAFSRTGFQVPQDIIDDVHGMTLHTFTATMRGSSEYLAQRAIPDRLHVLRKPLLVIFGENDRRWRSSSAEYYRAVPGARIVLLPGVGHSPNLEEPRLTADHLLGFTTTHIAPSD